VRTYRDTQNEQSFNPFLIAGFWLIAILASVTILYLTAVPLANAVFYKDNTFSVNAALGQRSYYDGDNFEMVVVLKNESSDLQLVNFTGACQATFTIYDLNNRQVYPRVAEEKPCNNTGYERFLIYSTQEKLYQFNLDGQILKEGKYKAVGYIDGFGTSDSIKFEVLERPNFFAQEGDLCEGATGRMCDVNNGLSCQHIGGFPFGAGLCMPKYDNFIPQDNCSNKYNNCFADVDVHPNKDLIMSYSDQGKLAVFGTQKFRPDDPIEIPVFEKFVSDESHKNIEIIAESNYIERDTAIEVLYKAFVENKDYSTRTLTCPFVDVSENPKKDYIIFAYQNGLLADNPLNRFFPNRYLSRIETLILVDRFRKFNPKVRSL